ncbi:Uncharacterised protein [Amycolatopsis camponoti]|uniref:Uncharacterized protein n=1 Tax=Amycolatopsis camponoti TaxID=2606593 RepID=A0A6I8LYK6_9PSEU|nr:Uncharacterised protein [Amycolatopsis camponoti]
MTAGFSTGSSLSGSAARRRRTLAHLSPIFEVHLNRARNPSDVDWAAYDFVALVQLSVDTIALSSGLDGNLGAPRETVLDEMTLGAAMMAPHRPVAEHERVARFVLDHLLRHDEPSPYFTVEHADADAGWARVTHQVRVLYETLAGDGTSLQVNADHTAVALLLLATNRSLEDEHEAVIAVMQAQADSGRLGAAIESAEDALTLSRTYSANVRRMIIEAERDVSRVNYVSTLRPELTAASRHLERRIQVDGTFLRHLESLRSDASEEQDPEAVQQLTVAISRLGEAVETLAELHTDVIGATPRWRDAQAAQAFTAVPATEVDPTADVLTALLTGRPLPAGADASPPAPARLLNFSALADRLVAPPRQVLDVPGREVATGALEENDGVYQQFPEQFHNVAEALRSRRIAPGMKARLSDLLADADALFSQPDLRTVAELAALAGGWHTARLRLRLLLALDALMLWRPDGLPTGSDDWWAVDDACRENAPDLDFPDLLLHRRGPDDRP